MQPFLIQCTTCKARLKVSDPSLVGDILACPKCDSMVQVVPPAGWSAVSAVAAAPAVVAAPVPAAVPAAVAPAAKAVVGKAVIATAASTGVAPAVNVTSETASPLPLEAPAGQGDIFTAAEIPAFLEPPPLIGASAVATSTAHSAGATTRASLLTKLVDNWPLVACGFAFGIVVGLGGYIVATMNRNSNQELSAASNHPAAASDAVTAVQHMAAKPVEAEDSDAGPAGNQAPVIEAQAPAELVAAANDGLAETTTARDSTASADNESSEADSVADHANDSPAAEKAADDIVARPADENSGDDNPSDDDSGDDEPAARPAEVSNAVADAPRDPVQPSMVNPDTARPAQAPPAEGPPLRLLSHTQIKQQLSQKLPAVEFDGKVPLEQFTRFIAELSGVPIEFDPAALAAVKKAGAPTVSVKLENTSIAKVLQTAVSQHGLTCVLLEDKVVIRKK